MDNITFPNTISVTEQDIDTSNLTEAQKQYYIDIFEKCCAIYTSSQKSRLIIGFAGPSGSGKSVLVELIKKLSEQSSLTFSFVSLGIDAYSYHNDFLSKHVTENKTLKEFKGRYDTYDIEKLVNDLQKFKNGDEISLPIYSRKVHNPVESQIKVSKDDAVLLIEGLWLTYNEDNWEKVNNLLDYSFFITADKEKVRELTISRHIKGGRTYEEANEHYKSSDALNFELVMKTKENVDEILPMFSEL